VRVQAANPRRGTDDQVRAHVAVDVAEDLQHSRLARDELNRPARWDDLVEFVAGRADVDVVQLGVGVADPQRLPTRSATTRGSNRIPRWSMKRGSSGTASARTARSAGSSRTTAGLTDGEQESGISTRPTTSPPWTAPAGPRIRHVPISSPRLDLVIGTVSRIVRCAGRGEGGRPARRWNPVSSHVFLRDPAGEIVIACGTLVKPSRSRGRGARSVNESVPGILLPSH